MKNADTSESCDRSDCLTDIELATLLRSDGVDAGACLGLEHLEACPICCLRANRLCEDPDVQDYHESYRRWRECGIEASDQRSEIIRSLGLFYTQEVVTQLFNRFTVRELLGCGGFGVVYLAEDLLLHRDVALKIPHAGRLIHPEAMRRFQTEVQVTATLCHPHVVPIYEAVNVNGLCYLIAEFCPGGTLADWIATHKQATPRQAARILLPLAEAMAHAHSRKVIHRDIKPSNVLLDNQRQYADLPFFPRLTDFGIAKLLDSDGTQTASGLVVGTPRYMAPEQALGIADEIGPAADLYALGVILYELCTGKPPIDGGDNVGTLRRVLSEEPTAPRRIANELPRDLEAVILKCLEKQPHARYRTVEQFAEDLCRFLSGQATAARPLPPPVKWIRWGRRNPAKAFASAVAAMGAALLTLGVILHSVTVTALNRQLTERIGEVRSANQEATRNEQRAKEILYASDLRLAAQSLAAGEPREADRLLARHVPQSGDRDLRGGEWHFLQRMVYSPMQMQQSFADSLYAVELSPDGNEVAVAGKEAIIRFCDAATGSVRLEIDTGQLEVNGLDFTEDGKRIVSSGDDGTLTIWNCATGEPIVSIQAHDQLAFGVDFFNDDQCLLSGDAKKTLKLWKVATGESLELPQDFSTKIEAAAVSPDNQFLAAADQARGVRILNLDTHERWTLEGALQRFAELAFSRDGRFLAAAALSERRKLSVWDVTQRQLVLHADSPDGMCDVDFSPDGARIVATDTQGNVRLWNLNVVAPLGNQVPPAESRPERVWYIDEFKPVAVFDSTGRHVITAGRSGELRSWYLQPSLDRQTSLSHVFALASLGDAQCVLADSEGIASYALPSESGDRVSPQRLIHQKGPWYSVDTAPRVGLIAAAFGDRRRPGRVVVWNAGEQRERKIIESAIPCEFRGLRLTADGKYLAATMNCFEDAAALESSDKFLLLYQLEPTQQLLKIPAGSGTRAVFSADGQFMIYGIQKDLYFHHLTDGTTGKISDAHRASINELAISRDGLWLASTGDQREIRLWRYANGWQLASVCAGHREEVDGMDFSPDGRTLFTVSRDGTLRGWLTNLGQSLGVLYRCGGTLDSLRVSPSGQLFTIENHRDIVRFDFSQDMDRR